MSEQEPLDTPVDDAAPEMIAPPPESEEAPAEPAVTTEAPTAAPTAATAADRRLVRSRDDRVIAGVCGGLGEYLGVDAVLIRIAALVLLFAGGAGALLYVVGWLAMPEAPEAVPTGAAPGTTQAQAPLERTSGAVVLGGLFILLGAFFLVDEIWSDFLAWKYVWPIVLILVGAAVLLRARR